MRNSDAMSIGEELSRPVDLLSANTTTWANREWLRGFLVVSRKFLVSKPAFRGEDIWIFEIDGAAMSYVGAVLHICLYWKISMP